MEGIAAIKEAKVMHRDLKLPNIMLQFSTLDSFVEPEVLKEHIKNFDFKTDSQTITVKIADLGSARKLEDGELAATGCGTPLLMAPEVLLGQNYNHKADVWSIGCLYYELLTGFKPFTGVNQLNLLENLKIGDYNFPKTVKLSLMGADFLNACLQYDV